MGRKRKVVMDEIESNDQVVESAVETAMPVEEPAADEIRGERYKVVLSNKNSYLNLRDGAGQSYKSIGKITEGTVVEAVGDPVDAGDSYKWIPVVFNGVKGYIFSGKVIKA